MIRLSSILFYIFYILLQSLSSYVNLFLHLLTLPVFCTIMFINTFSSRDLFLKGDYLYVNWSKVDFPVPHT